MKKGLQEADAELPGRLKSAAKNIRNLKCRFEICTQTPVDTGASSWSKSGKSWICTYCRLIGDKPNPSHPDNNPPGPGLLTTMAGWTPVSHEPLATLNEWVEKLWAAVAGSQYCSWEKASTTTQQASSRQQAIQSLGIATLIYGQRFKFRFEDNLHGELVWHGAAVGSVFEILQGNFKPTVASTHAGQLEQEGPLVCFSGSYSCIHFS